MSFNDKVVLVTGASSGIGAAIAVKFTAEGAKVAIVARNEKNLKDVSDKCEKIGTKPLVIIADVSKDDDAKRIITETLNRFGKLDVLVNNAGIVTKNSILSEDTVQIFDQLMSVNLRAVVVLTNLAAPHLIETKGNIINMSSIAATNVFEVCSFAYCVSKAGLDHFTRCIALELAPKGVRVNNIKPGPVKTDIYANMGATKEQQDAIWNGMVEASPLGRISDSEEVADLVAFLASDKARSITGASYVTDCGVTLKHYNFYLWFLKGN